MGFLRFLRRVPGISPAAQPEPSSGADQDENLLRYPPFIRGLPTASVDALLDRQGELLRRLQDGVGMTDADYRSLLLPVLRRFAAFVHLLPASESHHHRGSGGLLCHSLEVACLASQASMRHVFALDRDPKERYQLEPRWRVSAGLAGLLHDVGKPVADLTVSDRDGALTWSPYGQRLIDWAVRHGLDRYFLRWRTGRRHNAHLRMGPLVLHHVLTPEIEAWLGLDPKILANLVAVVAGQEQTSIIGALVMKADQASVERDLRENRLDPNAHALGVPVDRYLIDAMRRLVHDGVWTVNTPGSRLWMLPDGLHVVWPQGGEDIYATLAADNIPAIPRSPETIADVLVERGHVLTYQSGGRERFYRRLAPAPLVRDGKPIELTLLLLASPELALPGHPPAPVGLWRPDPVTEAVSALERSQIGADSPQRALACAPVRTTEHGALVDAHPEGLEACSVPEEQAPVEAGRRGDMATVDRHRVSRASAPDPAPNPAQSAPDPETHARAWLERRGGGGRVLLCIVDAIATGERAAGSLGRREDHLLVPYPEGLTGLSVPGYDGAGHLLQALWDAGMVMVDPRRPLLRVHELEGRHWTMLTTEATDAVVALLPSGECIPQAIAETAVAEQEADPIADTTPGTPPRVNASRAMADAIRALCEEGGIATVAVTEGCLITHETLAALAAQHGMPTAKLVRRLQLQPQFTAHPQGVLLLSRAP